MNLGLQDLNPVSCGWQQCVPGHAYGPAVREYYLIHYVLEGKGVFQRGESAFPLEKGDMFLIRPGELTFYCADKTQPWRYGWVGFSGSRCAALLEQTAFRGGNAVVHAPFVETVFQSMISLREGREGLELLLCGEIYRLLGLLQNDDAQKGPRRGKEDYVTRAADYMRANYAHPIRIEELARLLGIDRHYLSRLFLKRTSHTPQEFLIGVRLERAAQLLRQGDCTVGEAARSVGYEDVFHFSKMFKKRYGVSPTAFRLLSEDAGGKAEQSK